jgi:hypothetical protein
MAKIKGTGIDLVGTPDAMRNQFNRIPDEAKDCYSDSRGAYQGESPIDVIGIRRTNAIELRSDIETETGLQRPILDERHPAEFIVNTNTKGGSDPTRGR